MNDAVLSLAAVVSAGRPGVLEQLGVDSTTRGPEAFDQARFEATFAAVGRRLGTATVGGEATVSDASGETWSIATWGLDEVGRALLLLEGLPCVLESEQVRWIDGCYRAGALRERQAVLRALALLPAPARFLAVALDACRASTQPVFEAIACENPYPASYFPDASFNQMVLKAVFTEVAVGRIVGLERRRTPELVRMASDFAHERTAAGRSVPRDLELLTR